MKRSLRRAIHATLLVLFLVAAGLILRDASDTLRRPVYDAGAPTAEKFAKLWRVLPPNIDGDVTIDVPRALANPVLRDRLLGIVRDRGGIAAELVAAMLANQQAVGLLSLIGTTGGAGEMPQFAIVAQGAFDEQAILAAVRGALAAGRAGIVATDLGWATIYAESDARDPFGFMVLDRQHLAVGTQAALESFFREQPKASEPAPRYTRAVLFGHLKVGPRLTALVPPAIEAPAGVDLVGSEDGRLAAVLVCRDPQKAQDLQMFLEGVRSLLMLEQEQHLALTSLLKGISIAQESSQVTVASALFPLLDLWVSPPEE